MRKLDRSKPYGTIGGALDGRRYEQDGVLFGFDEKELGRVEAGESAPETVVPVAEVATPDQVDQQLGVGIDVDGDGKADVIVKAGKVTKVKGKRK